MDELWMFATHSYCRYTRRLLFSVYDCHGPNFCTQQSMLACQKFLIFSQMTITSPKVLIVVPRRPCSHTMNFEFSV